MDAVFQSGAAEQKRSHTPRDLPREGGSFIRKLLPSNRAVSSDSAGQSCQPSETASKNTKGAQIGDPHTHHPTACGTEAGGPCLFLLFALYLIYGVG